MPPGRTVSQRAFARRAPRRAHVRCSLAHVCDPRKKNSVTSSQQPVQHPRSASGRDTLGLLGSWGAVCSLCPRPTSGRLRGSALVNERSSRRDGAARLRGVADPAVSPLRYKRPLDELGEAVSRGGSGSLYVQARAKARRERSSARADPPYASLAPSRTARLRSSRHCTSSGCGDRDTRRRGERGQRHHVLHDVHA